MTGSFELVQETLYVVEVHAGAKLQVSGDDAERFGRWLVPRGEAGPDGVVHDLLERHAPSAGLIAEPIGSLVSGVMGSSVIRTPVAW